MRKGRRRRWSGSLCEEQRRSEAGGRSREEGEWEGRRGGAARRGEESANFHFKGIVGSSHGLRLAPHLSAGPAAELSSGCRILGDCRCRDPDGCGHHGEYRWSILVELARAVHAPGDTCGSRAGLAAGRGCAPSLAPGTSETHALVARLLRTVLVSPACEPHGHRVSRLHSFQCLLLIAWSEPGAGDVAGD